MNLFKTCFVAIALAASAMGRPQVALNQLDEPFNDNPEYNYQYQVASDEHQTYIAHNEERSDEDVTGEYSYVDPFGSLITVTYVAGPMGYTETRSEQKNFVLIRAKPQQFTSSEATSTSSNSGASSAGFGTRRQSTTTSTTSSAGSSNNAGLVSTVVESITPVVNSVVTETTSTSSESDSDLVARILAQLTPFIQQTVSSSLQGQQGQTVTTRRVTQQQQSTPAVNTVATRRVVRPVQTTRVVTNSAPVSTRTASSSSSSSQVQGIFGVEGANNVRFSAPEFNYEFDLQ